MATVPMVAPQQRLFLYVPADKFDMHNWKITIPSDINEDGRVEVK